MPHPSPSTVPVIPVIAGAPATQLFPPRRSRAEGGKSGAAKPDGGGDGGHESDVDEGANDSQDEGGHGEGCHKGHYDVDVEPLLDLVALWHEEK
eukprot:727434-Pyramimonas_sp.AAC.1